MKQSLRVYPPGFCLDAELAQSRDHAREIGGAERQVVDYAGAGLGLRLLA